MGKDKSWKLENTLKIDDGQLKTPEHDKLCIWVHKNYKKIIDSIIPKKILEDEVRWSYCKLEEEKDTGYPDYKTTIYCRRKIINDSENKSNIKYGFCVGAFDPDCPVYNKPMLDYYSKFQARLSEFFDIKFIWEHPIKNNGYVIGIPDFTIYIDIKEPKRKGVGFWIDKDITRYYRNFLIPLHQQIIIEVKPTIKSIGEVMRQLQIYRSYLPTKRVFKEKRFSSPIKPDDFDSIKNHIFLVTRDKEYKDIFENQDIHYYIVD